MRKAAADDVEIIASQGEIGEIIKETELGLLPVILSGSINAEYLKNISKEQKADIVNKYFYQFFSKNSAQISRFKRIVQSSSKSVVYVNHKYKCDDKMMGFLVPSPDSANIAKLNELPPVILIIETPCLYKNRNEFEKNEVSNSPDEDSDLDPGEECLHWVCKFVFWNRINHKTIAYGAVTAEGCGYGIYRYGAGGAWEKSITDLTQQIYEDTPFSLWDKGNYIKENVLEIIKMAPQPYINGIK
jgi:hypothetical protein